METIKPILSQMSISKPQLKFLLILFSTIMILRGRMNYHNMSRYSVLHEKSFSRNFKKPFDFTELNHRLILETIPEENKKMAAIDASFVPKSGKHSYGIDYFWSGVAGKSKKGRKSHLWQLLIWTIIPPTIFLLSRHLPAVELAKKRKIELIFTCSKFNVTRITCVLIVSFILRLMDLLLHLTRPQHR